MSASTRSDPTGVLNKRLPALDCSFQVTSHALCRAPCPHVVHEEVGGRLTPMAA